MLAAALQIALLLLFPAIVLYGERRSKVVAAISPVVICYGTGFLLANMPGLHLIPPITNTLVEAAVVLAIPLLLFPTDFKRWLRLAPKTSLSFGLAVISVSVVSAVGAWLFQGRIENSWQIAGMLVGVYTGGTPNMVAIAKAVDTPSNTLILVNAADILLGSIYLLVLMTIAKPALKKFFPAFRYSESNRPQENRAAALAGVALGAAGGADSVPPQVSGHSTDDSTPSTFGMDIESSHLPWPKRAASIAAGLGLSALIGAAAAGISFLLTGGLSEPLIILGITTLGIAASFPKAVRGIAMADATGQYLLLTFCLAIGTLANLETLAAAFTIVLPYCAAVLIGSITLHVILARVFRIDVDTLIITSTAAVFGPPFIGPIAKVLGNREVIVSGVTAGVIGLAIGNYVGIGMAMFAKWLLG